MTFLLWLPTLLSLAASSILVICLKTLIYKFNNLINNRAVSCHSGILSAQIHICCSFKIAFGFKIFKPEFHYISVILKLKVKLVRQSQILQGTIIIYSSDTIVTQVLTPAILTLVLN